MSAVILVSSGSSPTYSSSLLLIISGLALRKLGRQCLPKIFSNLKFIFKIPLCTCVTQNFFCWSTQYSFPHYVTEQSSSSRFILCFPKKFNSLTYVCDHTQHKIILLLFFFCSIKTNTLNSEIFYCILELF